MAWDNHIFQRRFLFYFAIFFENDKIQICKILGNMVSGLSQKGRFTLNKQSLSLQWCPWTTFNFWLFDGTPWIKWLLADLEKNERLNFRAVWLFGTVRLQSWCKGWFRFSLNVNRGVHVLEWVGRWKEWVITDPQQKESLELACGTISLHPAKTGDFNRKIC